MDNLANRLSNLSPEKLALLKHRLQAAAPDHARTRITRQSRTSAALPLSFAQERLWFLDQFQPGSAMYHIPQFFSFKGPLNVVALEQSLNEIIRRHEVLRTTFTIVDGQPAQIVAEHRKINLPRIDLRGLSDVERPIEMQRLANQTIEAPFDLARGPLLRIALSQLDEADCVLIVVLHHIISDGWSMQVFARELTQLYDVYSAGRPSPLTELPIQYADFSVWQRQTLSGDTLSGHLAYWKHRLDGAPPVSKLPTDRPRLQEQTHRGSTYIIAVSAPITEGLRSLARQAQATLFMVLLAAFQTILCRWTGQEDLVVGTLIANRNRVETESLIGFFVNTIPLRVDLSGNPSFRVLLERVRTAFLEDFVHQDLPFEKLVQDLHPERGLNHHPVFQVLFALQNISMQTDVEPGSSDLQMQSRTAKFDLALFMAETATGLVAGFEHKTDLFNEATIADLASCFVHVLAEVSVRPDIPIQEIRVSFNTGIGHPAAASDLPILDTYADDKFTFELSNLA